MLRTVSSMCPLATTRSSAPSRFASRNAQPKPRVFCDASPTPACPPRRGGGVWVGGGGGEPVEADHFVVEICDGHAGKTGVIEIGGVYSHSGAGFSFGAECHAGFDGYVLETAIALIAIEFVGLRVVGYQKVGPAIAIVVEHGDAERFGTGIKDAALGGHVFEPAVAAIVEEPASLAAIGFGRAIGFVFSIEAA